MADTPRTRLVSTPIPDPDALGRLDVSNALRRRRPRAYAEWKTLLRWGKLPTEERAKAGYLLRLARERSGLTQRELAKRLGCSQQAVAQAERWQSNPTVDLMERWAGACGTVLTLGFEVAPNEP